MKKLLSGVLIFSSLIGIPYGGVYLLSRLTHNDTPSKAAASTEDVYYDNCTEARESGHENIAQDEPGYRPELDRDGDGYACEPYSGPQ